MREDISIKKIGNICDVIPGQSPKSKFYNGKGEGLPFYQGKKRFTDKFLDTPVKWTTNITKEAVEGDILMSVRAPVGPVNFATQKICIGRGLAAIRPKENVDRDYLFYFFLKNEADLESTSGAVFDSINSKQIRNIKIPIPPLPEQKLIVAILDEAFEAIDKAKANVERNIHNVEELFQSKLNEVFSQRGEGWEEKNLGDVCVVERGSSPRPIKNYLTNDADGVNWIKIGDVGEGDKYLVKTKQKITREGAEKSRFVDIGDFILSNSMSYGRPYIMKIPGYIHDGWFVLRLPEEVNPDYLWQLLASNHLVKQFESLAAGAIVKNISSTLVKKAKVPLPPYEVQKKIVAETDEIRTQCSKLKDTYEKQLSYLEELKKSILQKAFSGELTVNEHVAV